MGQHDKLVADLDSIHLDQRAREVTVKYDAHFDLNQLVHSYFQGLEWNRQNKKQASQARANGSRRQLVQAKEPIKRKRTLLAIENGTQRSQDEPEQASPFANILDTGRLRQKFKDITPIGAGAFGKVYRASYHIDRKQYAIKVVRLHIVQDSETDVLQQIYQHRVYRELQAVSKITSENTVRYFNSWFEALDDDERQEEQDYTQKYREHL